MEETPAQGVQQAPQPIPTPETPHKKFSAKTLVLILILAVIAGILIFFALSMNSNSNPTSQTPLVNKQNQATPTAMVEKTALASFSPSTINMATTSSATVDIIITAGNTPITTAQVQITYDPTIIKNPRILPPDAGNSLFGSPSAFIELYNETDAKNGTITYAVGTQANGNPVVGAGGIGKLTFSVLRPTNGTESTTQISFGDDTAITKKGVDESILNSTTPLTITLQ